MKNIIIFWLALIPLIARAEIKEESPASITWKLYKMIAKGEPDKMAAEHPNVKGESSVLGYEYYWMNWTQ